MRVHEIHMYCKGVKQRSSFHMHCNYVIAFRLGANQPVVTAGCTVNDACFDMLFVKRKITAVDPDQPMMSCYTEVHINSRKV